METERYCRILGGPQWWAGLGLESSPDLGPRDLATWGTSASCGEGGYAAGGQKPVREGGVGGDTECMLFFGGVFSGGWGGP